MNKPHQPATQAVRAALESDTQFGAVVPPTHLTVLATVANTIMAAQAIQIAMRWPPPLRNSKAQ
jgi:hypothetical protein